MATFTGTAANETITPALVSPTVTVDPPGSCLAQLMIQ